MWPYSWEVKVLDTEMENLLLKPVVSVTYKNVVFKTNFAASRQPKEKVIKVNSASSQGHRSD